MNRTNTTSVPAMTTLPSAHTSPPASDDSCQTGCCGGTATVAATAVLPKTHDGHQHKSTTADTHTGPADHAGHDHGSSGDACASHTDDDSAGGCCGHDHSSLPNWPRISLALAFAAAAEIWHLWAPEDGLWLAGGMALAVVAIALSGLGIYRSGLRDLAKFKFGIDALMSVAVTGAFLIGQWPEAAMVMALYAAAERIEEGAMTRARTAIRKLLSLAPDEALVQGAGGIWQSQPASSVAQGSLVRIAPGARVPLDGVVTEGRSAVNQAPITGESALADKAPGDVLYAGSVNTQGELLMQTSAAAGDSTLARIVRAVEQAQATRAPTQRFVDRFAERYTPIVFLLAIALAVGAPLFFGWPWMESIYQALVLLVMACPCALVISTPVTVVSALATAAQHGILIKGGEVLEAARKLRVVALDKTGTLTTGHPELQAWQAWPASAGAQEPLAGDYPALTALAWALAERSDHPVSKAIAKGLLAQRDVAPAALDLRAFEALPGRGVQAQVDGQTVVLGNWRWIQERGQGSAELQTALAVHEAQGRSVTLLADDSGVLALFAVADTLRVETPAAIAQLNTLGLTSVVLSGDNHATVQTVAQRAGITQAQGSLLPEDKLSAITEWQNRVGPTAMVGDGINDAPALARADMGFAMGGSGSTGMAMETADVVLMNDDLRRVADTVQLSQRAHRVLWQNIGMALGVKLVFFILALAGMATLWMAVVADMGVSLLVVANGLRMRRWKGNR